MLLDSGPSSGSAAGPPPGAGQWCDHCPGDCADACFNDAIQRLPGGGVRLLADHCAGCGACLPVCDLRRLGLLRGCVHLTLATTAA